MIILTDEIAMAANKRQYTIGKPCNGRLIDKQYFTRFENALQEAVRIAVRLEIADGSITELRQIVTEQARLEQEFSEKLKGVYHPPARSHRRGGFQSECKHHPDAARSPGGACR